MSLIKDEYNKEELEELLRIGRTITIVHSEKPSQEVINSLMPWWAICNVQFNFPASNES